MTWQANIQATIDEYQLPWQVSRIGCRGEYSFRETAPSTGAEAAAAEDFELGQFLQASRNKPRHSDDAISQYGFSLA